jgi:hypothetical protein
MSARILATFCLGNLVVASAWASSADLPGSELVVYLSAVDAQPQRPLDYMKLELGRLMSTAGYRIEWADSRDPERPSTESPLAVVQLRGTCALSAVPPARVGALASTAVSGGQIIPFSSVDCTNLTRVLSAPLAAEPGARRDFLYGRAMARLLAHELYHVLLKTGDHSREGLARSAFTAADLLTERFEFEQTTLVKLRPPSAARPVASSADDSSTR